jgi:hypothetical protein
MIEEVDIVGDGFDQAKGRNGWFTPKTTEGIAYGTDEIRGVFNIYSRNRTGEAPICLRFADSMAARDLAKRLVSLAKMMDREAGV